MYVTVVKYFGFGELLINRIWNFIDRSPVILIILLRELYTHLLYSISLSISQLRVRVLIKQLHTQNCTYLII